MAGPTPKSHRYSQQRTNQQFIHEGQFVSEQTVNHCSQFSPTPPPIIYYPQSYGHTVYHSPVHYEFSQTPNPPILTRVGYPPDSQAHYSSNPVTPPLFNEGSGPKRISACSGPSPVIIIGPSYPSGLTPLNRERPHYQPREQLSRRQQPPRPFPIMSSVHEPIPHVSSTKVQPLGQIRRVTDTVVGKNNYSMDPLCPSNIDFQRRGIDEGAKIVHKVIKYASEQGHDLNFEDPKLRDKDNRGLHKDPSRVLGKDSLDFRWQMKHLCYNRTIYCKFVFGNKISEADLFDITKTLGNLIGSIAHQQNLADHYKEAEPEGGAKKCGTVNSIEGFFRIITGFVDEVTKCLQAVIPGLETHCNNLHSIYDSFHEYCQYRRIHHLNLTATDQMDKEEKRKKARQVLKVLQEELGSTCGEEEDALLDLITVRFAAQMNLSITDVPSLHH